MTPISPIVFIGHGSPMNAIENNHFTESWKTLGETLIKPKAIVIFSAHWITEGETRIASTKSPQMIYDMYGFPPELYRFSYGADGDPDLATEILSLLEKNPISNISLDQNRGFDHGVWSVLAHLFPHADVPVVSISLDYRSDPEELFRMGQSLATLREQGILFLGSGNIVHNLRAVDWSNSQIYPWAHEFDAKVAETLLSNNVESLIDFRNWGDISFLAHPTYDHLLPLLPLLGMVQETDTIDFLTPEIIMGNLSMRSIVWKNNGSL